MNQTDRVKTRILPENDSPGENLRARRAPRSLKMDQNRPKFKGDRSIERVSSRVKIRWFFQAKIRCKTDCSLSVGHPGSLSAAAEQLPCGRLNHRATHFAFRAIALNYQAAGCMTFESPRHSPRLGAIRAAADLFRLGVGLPNRIEHRFWVGRLSHGLRFLIDPVANERVVPAGLFQQLDHLSSARSR